MKAIPYGFLAVLFIFASVQLSYAAAPLPPLTVEPEAVYNGADYNLVIKWKINPQGGIPAAFNIYKADANTENVNSFILIPGQVSCDGDTSKVYEYISLNKPIGDYTFYITAQNGEGISQRSEFIHIHSGPRVYITSSPTEYASVGRIYSYDIDAQATNFGTVKYRFVDSPPTGMNINETTGYITWSPTTAGVYPVSAEAYLESSSQYKTQQDWKVKVKSCPGQTFIKGSVHDEVGYSIPDATVIMKAMNPLDPSVSQYSTLTELDGTYKVEVYEGEYKIYIEGTNIFPEWYDGKTEESEATIVNAPCGTTQTANFTVLSKLYSTYTVSGTIKKASGGTGIYPGIVEFYGYKNGKHEQTFRALTNDTGYYSIKLSDNYKYIAKAYDSLISPHLIPQYYNMTNDITMAREIELTGNFVDIDFYLVAAPNYTNNIFGEVTDSKGNTIQALIIPNRLSEKSGSRTIPTINDGYTIQNLEPGRYVLKVIPLSGCAAGYYKTGSSAVQSWIDASVFEVRSTGNTGPVKIKMPDLSPESGTCTIYGTTGGIPGVLITVANEQSDIQAYCFSNYMGNYIINNLPYGKYTLYADKIGSETFSTNVELTPNDPEILQDIQLVAKSEEIFFKTNPSTLALVYKQYKYNALAETNYEGTIKYKLIDSVPSGMLVNETSGALTWVPKDTGTYSISLRAYIDDIIDDSTSTVQKWDIKVIEGPPTTYIVGLVKDEDGFPVTSGKVTVNVTSQLPDTIPKIYEAIIGDDGTYITELPDSVEIILKAEGNDFVTEWYEDKNSETEATKVFALPKKITIINFTVKSTYQPANYTVSGKVMKSKDSLPLYSAIVEFMAFNKNDYIKSEFASTNILGEFKTVLSNQYIYIAKAYDSLNTPSYLPQYYKAQSNILEAERIKLTDSLTDVNFYLTRAPNYTNEIRGTVRNAFNNGVLSRVIAYLVLPDTSGNGKLYENRTTETSVSGDFLFKGLEPGDYIIKAIPFTNEYIPGYYKTSDFAVISWFDATSFKVYNSGSSGPHNIKVDLLRTSAGIAQVTGIITSAYITKQKKEIPLANVPIAGAGVYALDRAGNDTIRRLSVSNQLGMFELNYLEFKEYEIVADKVGYDAFSITVWIKPYNPHYKNDIYINPRQSTDIQEIILDKDNNMIAIPNPAADKQIVKFYAENISAKINIINSIGAIVFSDIINTQPFIENEYTIDLNRVATGSYYIRIISGSKIYICPIVVWK